MAIPSDLTKAEAVDYLATLAGSYEMRTRIEVLDNYRRTVSVLPGTVLGGQVDCTRVGQKAAQRSIENIDDPTASISRMAKQVTILDPAHAIGLDSNSPADGALFLDRMIRIICSVRTRTRWVEVPVFTGPITLVDRDGPVVTLEAKGMEAFGLRAAFTPGTVKGYKRAAFIDLMHRIGEVDAWMDIPTNDERLSSSIAIARDTKLWDEAFYVAAGLGRYCYYDGNGRLRTPSWSSKPAIEFRGGNDGLLLSEPQVSSSSENFKNAWWVKTSSKAGKDLEATAVLDRAHQLSPARIGLNGKPGYEMGVEEDGDLRTVPAAQKRAEFLLEHSSLDGVVQFEARPVFHLDPFDWMRVVHPSWSMDAPISEFSLPIVGGSPMTVGYQTELPSPNVARIRRV